MGFSQSVKTFIATAVAPIATASALIGYTVQLPEGQKHQQLTISAAASLQNALTEITPLFEKAHPDTKIFYNWGAQGPSSGKLSRAPPPAFFSRKYAANGTARPAKFGSYPATCNPPATPQQRASPNRPLDSSLTGFDDLIASPVEPEDRVQVDNSPLQQLAVGEFQSVPAGQYAHATLTKLNLLPQINPKLVFFSNVRGVLAAVENGHAQAGLVYRTDAELSDRVKIIVIAPPNAHPPIHYPVAVLQRSEDLEAAQTYIDFLKTPATPCGSHIRRVGMGCF